MKSPLGLGAVLVPVGAVRALALEAGAPTRRSAEESIEPPLALAEAVMRTAGALCLVMPSSPVPGAVLAVADGGTGPATGGVT